MENEWLDISNKLRRIHSVMGKKLDSLEDNIIKAVNAAKACEPEGVSLAINAGKLAVTLCNDVDHLNAVEIISEANGSQLKDGIKAYFASQSRKIFNEFAKCLGKETEAEIMARLLEQSSELAPWCLDLLVNFAQEVREIERRQSSD